MEMGVRLGMWLGQTEGTRPSDSNVLSFLSDTYEEEDERMRFCLSATGVSHRGSDLGSTIYLVCAQNPALLEIDIGLVSRGCVCCRVY
jgi:hypothetical protein